MARENNGEAGDLSINMLPEGSIANMLSFTCPRDACRLSVVSSLFRSAAESDVVWERFLPHDYQSIISKSDNPLLVSSSTSSKKQLYLSLCDNPILIEDGKKSFSLERTSGKKSYLLSARDLEIAWSDTPEYWRWISHPDSRFSEVADLLRLSRLEIQGKINTSMLSPATLYTAHLVFKFSSAVIINQPVAATVGLVGAETSSSRTFCWLVPDQMFSGWQYRNARRRMSCPGRNVRRRLMGSYAAKVESGGNYPKERGDHRWLEIELGEFFTKEGEEGELEMRVLDNNSVWKQGLMVEGIEIRPKEGNYMRKSMFLDAFSGRDEEIFL